MSSAHVTCTARFALAPAKPAPRDTRSTTLTTNASPVDGHDTLQTAADRYRATLSNLPGGRLSFRFHRWLHGCATFLHPAAPCSAPAAAVRRLRQLSDWMFAHERACQRSIRYPPDRQYSR
ncbi:hypothetical protein XbrCFBP1976_08090 [Xanthomonas bromi]|uniref:Uncharacterized protein n=1 Tax=Xanthomonas bromi TaxID=56449 RepID=A0ABX5BQW7_9XANT|nr:hypothetical protein XbrCFBP1976_08090 [Xanthomonas bromi]